MLKKDDGSISSNGGLCSFQDNGFVYTFRLSLSKFDVEKLQKIKVALPLWLYMCCADFRKINYFRINIINGQSYIGYKNTHLKLAYYISANVVSQCDSS